MAGRERGAVGKVLKRPSVLDQFVEYLRDHLLLDRSVDGKHFYFGKSLVVCLEAGHLIANFRQAPPHLILPCSAIAHRSRIWE
jgi:hypothetical protein